MVYQVKMVMKKVTEVTRRMLARIVVTKLRHERKVPKLEWMLKTRVHKYQKMNGKSCASSGNITLWESRAGSSV